LTEPEKRLWWHLRHRLPLDGTHFRRQVPIGRYLADFCCLRSRLVVEVDGGQHGTDAALDYDERRTAYQKAQGYRVLRFANHEVMRSTDVVLDTIHAALSGATPTPGPSPQGGGESARPVIAESALSVAALAPPTAIPNPSLQGGGLEREPMATRDDLMVAAPHP
jgi:very-short-patch-repair endonuclease